MMVKVSSNSCDTYTTVPAITAVMFSFSTARTNTL